MHLCEFSLNHYRNVLRDALNKQYRFLRFIDVATKGDSSETPSILLRHDVDVSLDYAYAIAQVERELGVYSSFFVRVHATGYSVLDPRQSSRLRELLAEGFEIGLHAEATEDGVLYEPSLHRQKAVLEYALGTSVAGVSVHLPKRIKVMNAFANSFLYEAGDEQFNRNRCFYSDSNRTWKPACFCNGIQGRRSLYVCIHPVWWVTHADPWQTRDFLVNGG